MKRLAALILLTLLFLSSSCAEDQSVDYDLTFLSGNILMNQVAIIRADPGTYSGKTIRVRGQYYAFAAENEIQRSLILTECAGNTCREIGLKLVPAEETSLIWPDNLEDIEITARIGETASTSGETYSLFHVFSVRPVSSDAD